MKIEILDESRSPIKTVLLEHHVGSAVAFQPSYAVRELRWFRSEEEAREHYEQAVRSHTKSHKRTDGTGNDRTQAKRKSRQNAL